MLQYLRIINGQMLLSAKRKSGHKRELMILLMLVSALLMPLYLVIDTLSEEDLSGIAAFVLPALILFDFSVRSYLKKPARAAVFPYLCLPVPRKALILYMILSDLRQFWVWGCWLLYGIVLGLCGTLTFAGAVTLLFLLLFNNYLTAFVKALLKGYAVLLYPVCLGFVCLILFVISLLNPFFDVAVSFFLMLSMMVMLYYLLKEDLYDELNRIAL
ncbi:MAG: hypothetical protein LBC47_03110 [Tannerella sp.]|jgi:hypothetical protein|nr:hypothetical protein [Tannerella sp.]